MEHLKVIPENWEVTECQNHEPLTNCTTRYYKETMLRKCKCLPFNIRLSDKVRCFTLVDSVCTNHT